jgi:hypothetical protein
MRAAERRLRARAVIEREGTEAILRVIAPGVFDPATGQRESTSTDHPVMLVVSGYEGSLVDGELVREGDQRFVAAAEGLPVEPRAGDEILLGGETHRVVNVTTVRPGDVPILHVMQARLVQGAS